MKQVLDEQENSVSEIKALAKRIKEKDKKVASLETQITDFDEEKFLMGEKHKEEMQSK